MPDRRLWLLVASLLLAAPAWAQLEVEAYRGEPAAARSVLVKFRAGAAIAGIQQLKASADIEADEGIGGTGVRRLRSRTRGVAALLASLRSRSDVEYAEPDYVVRAIDVPDDPGFTQLWGLRNAGQEILGVPGIPDADVSAPGAWRRSTGARHVVVAVIDTGLDYLHPDLAANVWSAPIPFSIRIGDQIVECAAGTHGYNAILRSCDPMDDHFHGTHVAGTVGAVGDNGLGVVGVNWVASIMGVKFLDATGSGLTSGAIDAIEFTLQAKATLGAQADVRVLSNSWGCSPGAQCFSQALLEQIERADAHGLLFVVAAGNQANDNDLLPTYPASYSVPNVVAVAATDNQDQLAPFSNVGAQSVHLGAPGVSILSSIPGARYAFLSGTSMATPHVSGAAALVLSRCGRIDATRLKLALLASVDPLRALRGITVTGGRLNVRRAVRWCRWWQQLGARPQRHGERAGLELPLQRQSSANLLRR